MAIDSTTLWRSAAVLLVVGGLAAYFLSPAPPDDRFVEHPLPLAETHRLFDIGVTDANGDERLDIYTSNHHFRQILLLADAKGGYRDVVSEWGLDQSHDFPLAELSYATPKPEQPGVYVYWRGTNLVLRAHRTETLGTWRGSLHTFDPVSVVKNDKGWTDKHERRRGVVTETMLDFTLQPGGQLILQPGGQGLPVDFAFDGAVGPAQLFVGLGKVSPTSTRFSLAMQDRHAHAWADFNGDGVPDVFINRGALSGTLRAHTAAVQRGIKDELFLSRGPGRFVESAAVAGIEKNGCSGRHAKWVDFDGDGLLDLFVNCYDREHVSGDFPKQLYRQGPNRTLREAAATAALALPGEQMGNLAWLDAEGDGDTDLLAYQDEGVFLYRNANGVFSREAVAARDAAAHPKIGKTGGDRWTYDGKLSIADFDADGDPDVFLASKTGNRLLRNRGEMFDSIDPATLGLPEYSGTAQWVDFDNDGRSDMHLFPQGLYRQRPDGRFEATGLFAYPAGQYEAAIINWFDLDNDGRLDVLLALAENPAYRQWWAFWKKPGQKGRWALRAFRNTGTADHWLQLRLAGAGGNPPAIGARVTVTTPAGTQSQDVGSSEGSFFSQGHYRLYFGLGPHAVVDSISVRWPDGSQERLDNVKADRLLVIAQRPGARPTATDPTEARQ